MLKGAAPLPMLREAPPPVGRVAPARPLSEANIPPRIPAPTWPGLASLLGETPQYSFKDDTSLPDFSQILLFAQIGGLESGGMNS